jgi:hypothetical protein
MLGRAQGRSFVGANRRCGGGFIRRLLRMTSCGRATGCEPGPTRPSGMRTAAAAAVRAGGLRAVPAANSFALDRRPHRVASPAPMQRPQSAPADFVLFQRRIHSLWTGCRTGFRLLHRCSGHSPRQADLVLFQRNSRSLWTGGRTGLRLAHRRCGGLYACELGAAPPRIRSLWTARPTSHPTSQKTNGRPASARGGRRHPGWCAAVSGWAAPRSPSPSRPDCG